jgi:DNA-binding NarL/FixJ family response regulator
MGYALDTTHCASNVLGIHTRLAFDSDISHGVGVNERAVNDLVLIESRATIRDCLSRQLRAVASQQVFSYASTADWIESADSVAPSLVILCADAQHEAELERSISEIASIARDAKTIVLCDTEDPDYILKALQSGARGCIPTSLPFDVMVGALNLVLAGGVYAPATALLAARSTQQRQPPHSRIGDVTFTNREIGVIEALRKGKPNKIIAYELALCEATVKVHLRNIMKKLKARNRTELALLANEAWRNIER